VTFRPAAYVLSTHMIVILKTKVHSSSVASVIPI
jgi:hypothetical protein